MSAPPILRILVVVGLVLALNSRLPGLVPTVLVLVALYAVLVNGPKIAALVDQVPAGLANLTTPAAGRARRPL